MAQPKKVVILGGGVGALAAAYFLTEAPNWQSQFEISIDTLGWRLGGKGASGRNADFGQRIEEHGLHIWYGYYENAFQMIQNVYSQCASLGLIKGSPLQTWRDAFHPHSQTTLIEKLTSNGATQYVPWTLDTLPMPLVPGDGVDLCDLDNLLVAILKRLVDSYNQQIPAPPASQQVRPGVVLRPSLVTGVPGTDLALPHLGEPTFLHAALSALENSTTTNAAELAAGSPVATYVVERFLDQFLKDFLGWLPQNADDPELRHLGYTLDFAVTCLSGCLKADVLNKGFEQLDQFDFQQWLVMNGATMPNSPLVASIYDGIFAFQNGDVTKPNLAAGTALRGCLRMFFTYKECMVYEMQAGMGDTIFAPLYLLLKQRGVNFNFFRRVTDIAVNAANPALIDHVDLGIQAELVPGQTAYNPLLWVGGVPCWPSTPDFSQLEDGAEMQAAGVDFESSQNTWPEDPITLQSGTDFDILILGMPVGTQQFVCQGLATVNTKWQQALEQIGTTATLAFQLWVRQNSKSLGWTETQSAILTADADPVESWSDMSYLIPREAWQPADNVQGIHYFFSPLAVATIPPPGTDPSFPAQQLDQVTQTALTFCATGGLKPLLPGAVDSSGALNWDLLAAPAEYDKVTGQDRFALQFFRANIDPSELYVLSGKGSISARLSPGNSGFQNLYLSGDWTQTVVNAGCVEGAVSSAMACSRAICGSPAKIVGENFLGAGALTGTAAT